MEIIFSSLLGLALGSFANVYFYRIPLNLSLWSPASHCPNCQHPLLWLDNIPILSYLHLKGRCRFCNNQISLQYPLIELSCSILFIAITLKFRSFLYGQILLIQFFSFILFLAAGIDLVTYFKSNKQYGIIPDHLNYLLIGSGILFSFKNPYLEMGFKESIMGSSFVYLLLMIVRILGEKIFKKESLGLGDVKLVSGMGTWLGMHGVLYTLILGSALGCAVSFTLIYLKKLNRSSPVPFGPFLVAGALGVLIFF